MTIRGGKLNTGFFTENKKPKILYHRGAMNICTNMELPTILTDHSCYYKFLSQFLNKQAYSIPPSLCPTFFDNVIPFPQSAQ